MKRGQSALEYLVTYGWAILAIVIVAALLWAMGIFNPGGLVGTGNKASGFTFNILDQKYAATTLTLSLANTQGKKVLVTGITVAGAGTMTNTTLNTGESAVIDVTGAASCGAAGDKYSDLAVVINYDIVGGIAGHTDSGTISGVCA
jgi:hypothetical protein